MNMNSSYFAEAREVVIYRIKAEGKLPAGMDPDEALARMLQEEMLREMQTQLQQQEQQQQRQLGVMPRGAAGAARVAISAAGATSDFAARLQSMLDTALRCEDPRLQERARAVMPLARLRAAAQSESALAVRLGSDVPSGGSASLAVEDLLMKKLLTWFKSECFTWVDTLPCSRCGSSATRPSGAAAPLPEDLAAGAGRVELHSCPACGQTMRFPRYNDPGKLLEPGCRRGRCGEWANAFLLCCRAAGLTARYVGDWTDHVWTEYYSHRMCRWVHVDSCEVSYDQPLLYESGWGKAVSYVVAAGKWSVTDVTRRYTARWQQEVLHRRTLVPEVWLQERLAKLTTSLRNGWSDPKALAWLGRDVMERMELRRRGPRPMGQGNGSAQQQQALPGRQTGSLEWRQQREETGTAAATPAVRSPTSYRLACDDPRGMPPVFVAAGCLVGGACRAAGHHEASEVVERLFDGRADTKWLDFGGGGLGGSSWVEYRMPLECEPVVLTSYELVSANDSPERDPSSWRIEAVTEEDFTAGRTDAWRSLHSPSGVSFPGRFSPLGFHLSAPSPPCRRLRLYITATANPRAANSVQLACWNLYGAVSDNGHAADGVSSVVVSSPFQRLRDMFASTTACPGSAASDVGSTSTSSDTSAGNRKGPVVAAATPGLTLLGRLLENIRREPQTQRFRKVRAGKLVELLNNPPLADVLLNFVRFRPLIAPAASTQASGNGAEAGGGSLDLRRGLQDGHEVFLVLAHDTSGDDLRRISEVLRLINTVM